MALVYSEKPCVAAGTFTTNVVKAAPVKWDQHIVYDAPTAQAIVCNSGVANACTGEEGMIVIGNPLKLSPGFPPLHTGHATFTASGVPSSIVSAVIHNHSFTLAKFATLPPVAAVLR